MVGMNEKDIKVSTNHKEENHEENISINFSKYMLVYARSLQ